MKKFISIFFILTIHIFASTIVRVGAYPFPPYLSFIKDVPQGKTVDLINALNQIQNKYKFQLTITSPNRRYIDFGDKFDLMFYEDLSWNWKGKNLESSDITLSDEEVFISLTKFYKTNDFVKDIKTKKILLIRGFHYAFANYNDSDEYLNKNFNVVFSTSPQNILEFLFNERAQIAIITKSFLLEFLNSNPKMKDSILISPIPDQVYKLSMLRSPNSPITIEDLNQLLQKIKSSDKFKHLL